ncbi:serine hydrolase domain-containing protein [Streptomyces sp. NBC_01276]|uniref:serine hydrolase domain-containing protein n=1 Tax=Streptomyces sp. NBC_01276 TaxID=2903808 RepID=UPI00352C8056
MTHHPSPRPLRTAHGPAPSGRRRGVTAVAAAAAALAVAGMLPASASASPAPSPSPAAATSTAEARHSPDGLRKALERVVAEDRLPGALASTLDREGRTRAHTAGVGDLRTGAKVPADGQVRVGSNTKTFTATVVLQLVGEGRVELDAPVDRYLPNLLRGDGIDGRAITVRQLLQHTSGLPNYTDQLVEAVFGKGRHTYYQPRELIDLALAKKARFAPGAGWEYSNTNYVVAGLLIEKVTGRPFAEQVTQRVIDRIGLRHTYFPAVGEERIREAHPRGYQVPKPGAPLEDITELDPSWGWSAGQLVSTPGDLNRFFSALIGGKLLEPAQLAQMRTTVKVDGPGWQPGTRYGLGLTSSPLSCGGLKWGHGGNVPGYHSFPGATDDGRAATIAVTLNRPSAPDSFDRADALLDTALCAR